jgi:predicted anti-sigma-YlaC factor YlaD
MHKPTLEGLEEYLAGRMSGARARSFSAHLDGCAECRGMVDGMRLQSGMVRSLKAPADVEPPPGFYARVMERIEAQAACSLWSVFLEPFFLRRFMYASLALMMLFVVGAASVNNGVGLHQVVPVEMAVEITMPDASSYIGEEDREVVFVNLASFAGGISSAPAVKSLPTMED